jgi:hypothetical protein
MSRSAHRQSAGKVAAAMAAKLTDQALADAWMMTEAAPVGLEAAIVRGWMMDEIQARLGDDLFDEWLMDETAEGSTADPITYLDRAKASKAARSH